VPQRYRKAMDQYQALLLEIEMAERSFLDLKYNTDPTKAQLDPRAEKDRLQKLFDTARADQQANYPDLYVSTGAHPTGDSKDNPKDSAQELKDAKAETEKVRTELMAKIEELLAKLGSKLDAHVEDTVHSAGKA
jgi:hypothetical protein